MEGVKERATQLLSLAALIVAWALLAEVVSSTALPPPSDVSVVLWELLSDGSAFPALFSTLFRTVVGFLLGFLAGTTYGILVYLIPGVGDFFSYLFRMIMFMPTLVVIFVGLSMFGYGNGIGVILIAGLVIFPNVAVYIRDALVRLDEDIVNMSKSFKASLWQRVRGVYLPFLIPPMLGAGRIGFSLAWKVTFLAEVFGFPEGLGWQVRVSYSLYDMSALLAWLAVFVLTLLLVEQLTRGMERFIVRW